MADFKCPMCGCNKFNTLPDGKTKCVYCGNEFAQSNPYDPNAQNNPYSQYYSSGDIFAAGPFGKSRGVAGLLAILLGAFGAQYFYLGKTSAGIICLIITLITCGIAAAVLSILFLIQGIMMMTMTQQEFDNKYTNTSSSFPIF